MVWCPKSPNMIVGILCTIPRVTQVSLVELYLPACLVRFIILKKFAENCPSFSTIQGTVYFIDFLIRMGTKVELEAEITSKQTVQDKNGVQSYQTVPDRSDRTRPK